MLESPAQSVGIYISPRKITGHPAASVWLVIQARIAVPQKLDSRRMIPEVTSAEEFANQTSRPVLSRVWMLSLTSRGVSPAFVRPQFSGPASAQPVKNALNTESASTVCF